MTSGRVTSWLSELNAITWKTVVVGVLQAITVLVVLFVWARKSLDQTDPHDMHTDTLNALFIFLASLSGITLGGLAVKRTTDIDYQIAKNAGKPQTVQTGDSPLNVNTTATMPVPVPDVAAPARRSSSSVLDRAGPRALVTDHDEGVM